jgi:hypothetical protein
VAYQGNPTNPMASWPASAGAMRGLNGVRVHGPWSFQLAAFSSPPEGELAGLLTSGDGDGGSSL